MAFLIPLAVGAFSGFAAFSAGATLAWSIGIGIAAAGLTQLLVGGAAQVDPPRPDELDTSTTTESRPVPVVFGRVRLPGNYLRMDKSTFVTKTIEEDGGWFSDDVVVGYEYFITFDYGICTGAIDRLYKVIHNPGEEVVWSGSLAAGDVIPANIRYVKDNGSYIYISLKDSGNPIETGEQFTIAGNSESLFNGTWTSGKSGERYIIIYSTVLDPDADETLRGYNGTATGSASSAYRTSFYLRGKDKARGSCRFYWGTSNQIRSSSEQYHTDVSNHRNIVWCHCPGFFMGSQPNPGSLLFEVLRYPKCYDAAGDEFDQLDFPTSGSNDGSHPAYYDANPAAAIYELLTNKLWGRGLEVSRIDVAAFQSAAKHYQDNDVGMSFSLGTQNAMSEAIDMVRKHCQLYVFAVNDVLTCRALSDKTNAYLNPVTLTRDMMMDITLQRTTWQGTVNELRAVFVNREKNFEQGVVSAQDLASITMANAINSRQVNLKGFSNRKTAESQVYRLLQESAFPAAKLSATLTRFHADVVPGAFVEFVIDDYYDNQPTTSYWRVIEITDEDQDPAGMKIMLEEDPYATPFVGYPAGDFIPPTPSYEIRDTIDEDDINFGDDFSDLTDPGEITDFDIVEMPVSLTLKQAICLMALDAETADLTETDADWKPDGEDVEFKTLYDNKLPRAYKMTLDANLDALNGYDNLIAIQRNKAVGFTIANEWQRGYLEDATGLVVADLDDFAQLTQTGNALIFMGNEIIQVGYATETATGVEVINFMRGCYGTDIQDHTAGAEAWFFESIADATNSLAIGTRPLNTDLELEFEKRTLRGSYGISTLSPIVNIGTRHLEPLKMTEAQTTKNAGEWTVYIRPRSFSTQMSTRTIQSIFDEQTPITGLGVRVKVMQGNSVISDEDLGVSYFTGASPSTGVADYEWIAQQPNSLLTGCIKLRVLGVTGSRNIDIYTIDQENGYESTSPLEIF